MISAEKIPNNVGLSSNKRLQRALEHWQPAYIQWWRDMGPQGFQDLHQVYVRTAISVDSEGWAHLASYRASPSRSAPRRRRSAPCPSAAPPVASPATGRCS